MNVVQNAEGRYRMSGLAFIVINLVLCVITAGAWLPIAVIWLICRALRSRGGSGPVQVVVSNNVAPVPLYQPYQLPPGYMLVPAPQDAQVLPSPR